MVSEWFFDGPPPQTYEWEYSGNGILVDSTGFVEFLKEVVESGIAVVSTIIGGKIQGSMASVGASAYVGVQARKLASALIDAYPNATVASFKTYRIARNGDRLVYNYCYKTEIYKEANYKGGVIATTKYYEQRTPT